jgi:hypothetical protein
MNLDPTLFTNPMYETANEAVLFCQEFLQEKGYLQFAIQLAGFTPVSCYNVAVIVRDILVGMQTRVRGEAAEYVAIALSTVCRAINGERTPLSAVA